MKLSIYLSETVIRAVVGNGFGKLQIQDCSRFHIREGTWINDMIIDENCLKEILMEVKHCYSEHLKNTHIVVGSRALTKVIQVPPMSKRQLMGISRHELTDFGVHREDMVYDYSVIHTGKEKAGGVILCAGLERRLIDSYVSLFGSCGIKVKSMGIALNSIVQLAEYLPELSGRTYILSVLEGRNLMSTLYVNGIYTYTSRVRLLPEFTMDGLMEETIADLNAIIRFQRMQGMSAEVETIYFCGLKEEEENIYFPLIAEGTKVAVRTLGNEGIMVVPSLTDYRLGDYIFASGNLLGR